MHRSALMVTVAYTLKDKVIDGKLYVDQGIIAGCAGGGFENICAAADILKGQQASDQMNLHSAYIRQVLRYTWNLSRNGVACRPPCRQVLSLRLHSAVRALVPAIHRQTTHSVSVIRPETSRTVKAPRLQNGQIASVALMDARSIAATAANKGFLTSADRI